MNFTVFKFNNSFIFALLADTPAKVRRGAISYFPTNSPKKRVLRVVLRILRLFGTLGMRRYSAENLPIVDEVILKRVVSSCYGFFNINSLWPMLLWPSSISRNRYYVQLLDDSGNSVAFAKVGLGVKNVAKLRNERLALEVVSGRTDNTFKVPALVDSFEFDDGYVLITSSVSRPGKCRSVGSWELFEDACASKYRGKIKVLTLETLMRCSWWVSFTGLFPKVASELKEFVRKKGAFQVCFAHGDVGLANVMRNEKEFWIIDWEESSRLAPIGTDCLCLYLSGRYCSSKKEPSRVLQELEALKGFDRVDLLLSLAYLATRNVVGARRLVQALGPGHSLLSNDLIH